MHPEYRIALPVGLRRSDCQAASVRLLISAPASGGSTGGKLKMQWTVVGTSQAVCIRQSDPSFLRQDLDLEKHVPRI